MSQDQVQGWVERLRNVIRADRQRRTPSYWLDKLAPQLWGIDRGLVLTAYKEAE